MEKIITNKKSFNIFFNKAIQFLKHLLPGMVILELFFEKGYFSEVPETVYEFIIYVFWCLVLSIPINNTRNKEVDRISIKLKEETIKIYYRTNPSVEINQKKLKKFDKLLSDNYVNSLSLGWSTIKTFIFLVLFKMIDINFSDDNYIIPSFIILYIISLYPVSILYSWSIKYYYKKQLKFVNLKTNEINKIIIQNSKSKEPEAN